MAQKKILSVDDLENPPIEDESAKTVTSEWAFDHAAALDVHTKNPLEIVRAGGYYSCPEGYYTAIVLVADRLYAKPFIVVRDMTFDRIAIDVTALDAGKNARLGIYNLGTNLYPGTLLLDAGTVSVATTGVKSITISQALTKGIYFVAMVTDGTPNVRGTVYHIQIPNILGLNNTSMNIVYSGWTVAQAYGALPDPFTAAGALGSTIPRIPMRVLTLD